MLSYPTRISNEVSLSLNKAHPGVLARGRHFFPWCGWESLVNFPHMFQVHSELAAVPEQHDGCGLYDGSGCRVSAGHRRASRPPLSISCSVPGKPEGNIGNCTTLQAEIKKKRGKKITYMKNRFHALGLYFRSSACGCSGSVSVWRTEACLQRSGGCTQFSPRRMRRKTSER